MERKNTINIIVAILLGLMIVFPDLSRKFDNSNAPFPQQPPKIGNIHPEKSQGRPITKDKFAWKLNEHGPRSGFENYSRIGNDFLLFFILTLLLIYLNTGASIYKTTWIKERKKIVLSLIVVVSIFISILFAFLYTKLAPTFLAHAHPQNSFADAMTIFKCLFAGLISILFGHVMRLIYQHQEITIENEQLKTENIQNRFDALTAQINPHFFFNSLNSLASLVREKNYKNSLKYIDELSSIFRYVLKSNWQELVSLEDEMKFLDAYRFMLEIRYENKLFFEISVDANYLNFYKLPALSLQPLIENCVKHNTISAEFPMTISIFIDHNNHLVVTNPIHLKLEKSSGTGIGIENLNNRYKLLTGKTIEIEETDTTYCVSLPLQPIKKEQK